MLSEQKYSLVSRGGRYYVNPKDSVALLKVGKWISGRPTEFANNGNPSRKIEIYVDDALADSVESIFNSIFEQYVKNGGTGTQYQLVSEYEGQKKLSLKVNDDTVFYKQNAAKEEIEEITFAQLPSNFDCFPIINLSSAWELPIREVDTFGVTLYCKELVITPSTKKYTKRAREDKGASASNLFKVAKKSAI